MAQDAAGPQGREAPLEGAADAAGPNASMIAYWNDVVGPGWVRGQEAIDAHLAPIGRLAVERAAPEEGERALDVGCGCGASTLALANRVGSEGRVTGVDVSAPMLARAGERARSAGLENVDFLEADAAHHAFEPEHDLVFSRFGVMFFSEPAAAFRNLRSALRPGGRLCFVCWRELGCNPWMGVPMQAASRLIPVDGPPPPGQPGPYGLADGDALRARLVEAGFEALEIEPLDIELPLRGGVGVEDAAVFMSEMGPVAAALREAGEEHREPVRRALEEALRPHLNEEGVVALGVSVWLVHALQPD